MKSETWLEHYGLTEYPEQLRVQGTKDEIFTPKEITSTGNVIHPDGHRMNIWWYEPLFVEPVEYESVTPIIKIDMSKPSPQEGESDG